MFANATNNADSHEGDEVVTNGVTNHVGLVDMVVSLGDGTWHPAPYNQAANPYNYSDMTGFNNRIVNPGGQPLKGYWSVIDDSGIAGEWWQRVSWSNSLPTGCTMEVFVRANDDRATLANGAFVAVSNNVPFTGVNGRYIEVHAALTRDDASQWPVLYDLTLHGLPSGYNQDAFLDDVPADETHDATFTPTFTAPGPLTYQWFVQYPWMSE